MGHDSDVHVLATRIELRLRRARSLKDKRQVVRSLLDRARARYDVSAAEVGAQDVHDRAVLGFALVSSAVGHAEEVMDAVEGLVWSHPEVEVADVERGWLER